MKMTNGHACTVLSQQIGPDDWETSTRVMDLTSETTVGEIVSWFVSTHRWAQNEPLSVVLQVTGHMVEEEPESNAKD